MIGPRSPVDRRRRSLRRRQIRRILARPWATVPGARRFLDLLRACIRGNDERGREKLLDSPLLAGWIHDVLFWMSVRDQTETILTGRGSRKLETALFERIARTEFLLELVPSGRLDSGFTGRVRKRALRALWERMADLPRILLPHFRPSGDPLVIPLFFREIPDEGCPADRIRLGESPLWVVWGQGPPPMAIRTDLAGGSLVISAPVEVEPHEIIPGTGILVAHRLVSTPGSLRVGDRVPGLARRLARALALVEEVWPRAAREIRERTWLVVPLVEPGTVSYSHAARPGISYLNVFRGSLLDLSDDLLHETAHHRLYALQEVETLLRDDGDAVYFSPWRGTPRPLHGILHGAFTFLYRAELLARILRARRAGAAWRSFARDARRRIRLEAEARRELSNCAAALAGLARAGKEGLLTRAGAVLVDRMRRRHRALARRRLSPRARSTIL